MSTRAQTLLDSQVVSSHKRVLPFTLHACVLEKATTVNYKQLAADRFIKRPKPVSSHVSALALEAASQASSAPRRRMTATIARRSVLTSPRSPGHQNQQAVALNPSTYIELTSFNPLFDKTSQKFGVLTEAAGKKKTRDCIFWGALPFLQDPPAKHPWAQLPSTSLQHSREPGPVAASCAVAAIKAAPCTSAPATCHREGGANPR